MTTTTARDVLLFIPNLIGYVRVILTILAFLSMIFMEEKIVLSLMLYVGSFVGDLFDGMAARRFNQSSHFGGMLDMITDRCSTAGLLMILTTKTDSKALYTALTFLLLLDISNHWAQMVMSLYLKQHHKSGKFDVILLFKCMYVISIQRTKMLASANEGRFFLVRWFYGYYPFFGYLCVGAEFTYVLLYATLVCKTDLDAPIMNVLNIALLYICLPAFIMKQFVYVARLCSACYAIAENDAGMRNSKK